MACGAPKAVRTAKLALVDAALVWRTPRARQHPGMPPKRVAQSILGTELQFKQVVANNRHRVRAKPNSVDISREIAYAISAASVAKALGDPEFAGRDPYLDLAYFQLDVWKGYLQGYPNVPYPGEPGAQYQPFMFALTAEALINTYQCPDTTKADKEKIRTRLDALARLTYNKLYNSAKHAFIANTGNPTTYWPAINLLIVPLYGWLWHETGEPYFLQAGDKIFSDGVVYGWPEVWGGKQFSQNYRWSFDYVVWRTAP